MTHGEKKGIKQLTPCTGYPSHTPDKGNNPPPYFGDLQARTTNGPPPVATRGERPTQPGTDRKGGGTNQTRRSTAPSRTDTGRLPRSDDSWRSSRAYPSSWLRTGGSNEYSWAGPRPVGTGPDVVRAARLGTASAAEYPPA